MDEGMEKFIEECFEEPLEIDEKYEFDASSFFDFTRPESDSEIEVAERWFEISGDYPTSPFIVKLNLGKVFSVDDVHNSANSKDSKKVNPMSNSSDVESRYGASPSKKNTKGASSHILQNNAKTKTKSATKLCQSRSSKKVTVPKEPELETLLRAQKRRSKNSSESSEHEKPKASAFRARQSSRKILQTPSLHQPNKKTKFQEFHLKTMERATQHVSANVPNSHKAASHLRSGGSDSKRDTLKPEKRGPSCNSKSQKVFPSMPDDDFILDIKQDEFKIDSDNSISQIPPMELFNKLSPRSDIETDEVSRPKTQVSKEENVPGSFQPEFWKCHAKPNQCEGQMRVSETEGWSKNRNLGIS